MKALVIDDADPGTARLVLRELEVPIAGPSDLLVRVAMVGINRADLALSKTHYAENPAGVAGSELSGEVVAVGAECRGFEAGDRVMALSPACFAQFASVDHRLAVRIPAGMDWRSATALPAWYMTAHNALVGEGGLQAGEAVLIQGATSGVGIAAAQLARLFGARTVIGVARSAARLRRLDQYGFNHVFTADSAWPQSVRDASAGRGVDLIIDMVGRGALAGNVDAAAICGRIVAVGRLGGPSDTLDIALLAYKRIRLIGVTFRTRSIDEKAEIARAFAADVLSAIAEHRITPPIDSVFPFAEAQAALAHVRSNAQLGKVLLEVR